MEKDEFTYDVAGEGKELPPEATETLQQMADFLKDRLEEQE